MPGTGQEVDPRDVTGTGKTFLMTAAGFALTAGAATVGVGLWNRAADTSDRFDEIEVI